MTWLCRHQRHSTRRQTPLKRSRLIIGGLCAVTLAGATQAQAPATPLQERLARIVSQDGVPAAIAAAQTTLAEHPDDPEVQAAYIDLHLDVASRWIADGRYDDALVALDAVLRVNPRQPEARNALERIRAAQDAAPQRLDELRTLLVAARFAAALDLGREITALRSDLHTTVTPLIQQALEGAAEDHLLAGNFPEAFSLLEQRLHETPAPAKQTRLRWILAGLRTLAERASTLDTSTLLTIERRLTEESRRADAPDLGAFARALIAEINGERIDAGRLYARILQTPWSLPPAERRAAVVIDLRKRAWRALYAEHADLLERRLSTAVPHPRHEADATSFEVHGEDPDLVTRVTVAAAYHLPRMQDWLGVPRRPWRHPMRIDLQPGVENHVAIDVRADTVAMRRARLDASDAWLLGAALPAALLQALVSRHTLDSLPPLLEAGLIEQVAPPALVLKHRRNLTGDAPRLRDTLQARPGGRLSAEQLATAWALGAFALAGAASDAEKPDGPLAVIRAWTAETNDEWYVRLGFKSDEAAEAAWRNWYALQSDPVRAPIMLLNPEASRDPGAEESRDR